MVTQILDSDHGYSGKWTYVFAPENGGARVWWVWISRETQCYTLRDCCGADWAPARASRISNFEFRISNLKSARERGRKVRTP